MLILARGLQGLGAALVSPAALSIITTTFAEGAERASQWAEWAAEQERTTPPRRPLLLDAPPIGCPDHPNGRIEDCGPCGTFRRRHDRWVAQQRYTEQVERFEAGQPPVDYDPEEPF